MSNENSRTILRTFYEAAFPQAQFKVCHLADESKDFGFSRQLMVKIAGQENWRMIDRESADDLFRDRDISDYLERAVG